MSILKGKTVVVTGSTSGIGLGCAREFAGAGANIVFNGMGAPAEVEKERSAIKNDFGVKPVRVQCGGLAAKVNQRIRDRRR